MKLVVIVIFSFFFTTQSKLLAHCQIPCGIYDDALRIAQLQEDFRTIKKAMTKIKFQKSNNDAHALNQSIRWIQTKDRHADQIQETVSTYFLTQRIKAKNINQGDSYKLYVSQTTNLHQLMIAAMKCKQTVDLNHVQDGLKLLDKFIYLYFDEHGQGHLKTITKDIK
tara:strand:+ start:19 stop:519 length:501 start_codon:yes stop_codon:yes gene_type:complete